MTVKHLHRHVTKKFLENKETFKNFNFIGKLSVDQSWLNDPIAKKIGSYTWFYGLR